MYVSLILIRNVIQIFGYDQVYLSLKFSWNEIWIKKNLITWRLSDFGQDLLVKLYLWLYYWRNKDCEAGLPLPLPLHVEGRRARDW